MAVTGIGGIFFRARDPKALQEWYRVQLGIGEQGPFDWRQEAGQAVFMPFSRDTDYFPADRQFMLNFRVTEFDQLLERLRAAGIEVVTNPAWDSPQTGRFARVHDPEGNPVELWEPPVE